MQLFIAKINFWDFFPNLFSNLLSIRKNNFCKAFFQFAKINSAKSLETKLFWKFEISTVPPHPSTSLDG